MLTSGRAGNIDAGHEGARQDQSGCKCTAEECLFSAAAPRKRAVETGLSVLEDLTGSYLLKQQIPE